MRFSLTAILLLTAGSTACAAPASGYMGDGGVPAGDLHDDDAAIDDDDLAAGDDDTSAGGPVLLINEFMADNEGSLLDEQGVPFDWLELYNAGDAAVFLDGYSLSDDWTVPDLHVLETDLVLGAGEHLLLWASGGDGDGVLHIGFRLSAQGEAFGLFDGEGEVLDWITYPAQQPDHARGRAWDGADEWEEIPAGTPGESND